MAALGHGPISSTPISALPVTGAPPPVEDDILGGTVMSLDCDVYAYEAFHNYQDDVTGQQAEPFEDTPAIEDDILDVAIPDSIEDDVEFDVSFYILARGPPDQDDDYVPPPVTSDLWADDDATDGGTQLSPLEDEPVVADDDRVSAEAPDYLDDEELPFDWWLSAPPDQDDDEPIAATTITPDAEDEAWADWTWEPLAADGDETGETTGAAWTAIDLPEDDGVDGWTIEPPDQDDDYIANAVAQPGEEEAQADGWLGATPDDGGVCVFPTAGTPTTGNGTDSTSFSLTLPSGSGGKLLWLLTIRGDIDPSATGWTLVGTNSAAGHTIWVYEGNDTSSTSITQADAEVFAWAIYRVADADAGYAIEAGGSASGSSTTPDSASFSPSWGSDKTLWFSAFTLSRGDRTVSSYPTNYADNQTDVIGGVGATGIELGAASRQLEAASEDPGSFTVSGTGSWRALTVAIKGICNVADDGQTLARSVPDYLEPDEVGDGVGEAHWPLDDAPTPDDTIVGRSVPETVEPDAQWEDDGWRCAPLDDAPAAPEETITGRSVPDYLEPDADDAEGVRGLQAWISDADAPVVEPPAPAPTVSTGGGGGWWIGRAKPRKPVWPDLPKQVPPAAPPWRTTVVTKDTRARLDEVNRVWKTKMRRSRKAEDEIILAIIAAMLAEDDD